MTGTFDSSFRSRSQLALATGRLILATSCTVLALMAATPGDAGAATTRTMTARVPATPAIRVATLTFASRRSTPPQLGALRSAVAGLPADVTFLTGARKNPATGRWVALVTTIRWNTGKAAASGATGRIRVYSDLPFTVGVNTRSTGTRIVGPAWGGGGYTPRVGRYAGGTLGDQWGGARDLLREVGNGIAGIGNPDFQLDATGTPPADRFVVEVSPSGDGSGRIEDNFSIRCRITGGAVTGTCSQWYYAGTGIVVVHSVDAGSVFEGWTGACSGFNSPVRTCDLGRPAGGQVIRLGGLFVKVP